MKKTIIALLILPVFCVCQNSNNKTEAENAGLLGKVKQITSKSYESKKSENDIKESQRTGGSASNYLKAFDTQGRFIKEYGFKEDGTLQYSLVLKYRDDGKLREVTQYYNGVLTARNKSNYTFNSKGLKIAEQVYDTLGVLLSKGEYKYDENGNLAEDYQTLADGSFVSKRTYTYDAKGNKTEELHFNAAGDVILKITLKYDGNGNETEWCSYNKDGGFNLKKTKKYSDKGYLLESIDEYQDKSLYSKYTYLKHNDKGKPVEGKSFKADGSLEYNYYCKYDEKGDETEMIWKKPNGTVSETRKYEYDKAGNWIKSISYWSGTYSITLREIEYY